MKYVRARQTSTTPPRAAIEIAGVKAGPINVGKATSAMPEEPGVGLSNITIHIANCLAKISACGMDSINAIKIALRVKNLAVQLNSVDPNAPAQNLKEQPFKLSEAKAQSSVQSSVL